LITLGTIDPAVTEARDWLKTNGIETNYLRVRALPLSNDVFEFINKHETTYIIENNFDGQLYQIIHIDYTKDLSHIKSLALGDGLPMTARWIVENIEKQEAQ
jgi:2-oxoglutarate ferredoxin oxidoreductase subunit alpha